MILGLAITVFSILLRSELYRLFPIVSPDVLALLSFFAGSILVGGGMTLAIAGLLRKTERRNLKIIIIQGAVLVVLVIILSVLAFRGDRSLPSRMSPAGPVTI